MKWVIFLLLVFYGDVRSYGQSLLTQNTSWSSTKTFEVSIGKLTVELNKVIVYGAERIDWIDARGNTKYSLTIKSTKGTWNDVGVPGEMTYQVQVGQQEQSRGLVTIRKSEKNTTITFALPRATAGPPVFWELMIGEVSVL